MASKVALNISHTVVYYMVIGKDVAVRADYESGAGDLTRLGRFGWCGVGAAADCTTGFATGFGIEKSPALAMPPDLVFATQLTIVGRSSAVDLKTNWNVVPFITATIKFDFRTRSIASFGMMAVTEVG